MKEKITKYLVLLVIIYLNTSCTKNDKSYDIIYQSVNKEYILLTSVQALQASDDEISDHVDSIMSGKINTEFISTGQKDFDLDQDLKPDIGFEIIDLNNFNPQGLPDTLDSLAARIIPLSIEILDNSTYRYPDALSADDQISGDGNWSDQICVLGTFMNAGQFQGKGEKFLGIRLTNNQKIKYGWIRLYCSQHNDTLRIIDYAYNNISGDEIKAGQKE